MHRASLSFCQRLRQCRTSADDSQRHFIIRLTISLVFLVCIIVAKAYAVNDFKSPDCIRDDFFDITQGMNSYLAAHPTFLKAMIVTTSWNIELMVLSFMFLFIFYYRSWRPCIWSVQFYICRGILQLFFGLRVPAGYLWKNPGVPSLIVPYSVGDFFYSGHVGLLLAMSMEFYHYKQYWMSLVALIFNVYNTVILVVTRSHYSIDIVGGLIFSLYFYKIAGYICEWMETKGIVYQRQILSPHSPAAGTGGQKSEEEEDPLISLNGDSGGIKQPIIVDSRTG